MKQAKLKRRVCLTYLAKVFKHDTTQYMPYNFINDTTMWRVTQKYFANAGWFEFTGKCELSIGNWPIWFPGYTVYQFPVNLALTWEDAGGGKVAVFIKSSVTMKDHPIMEFDAKAHEEINSFGTWFGDSQPGDSNALTRQFSCDSTCEEDEIILNTGFYLTSKMAFIVFRVAPCLPMV